MDCDCDCGEEPRKNIGHEELLDDEELKQLCYLARILGTPDKELKSNEIHQGRSDVLPEAKISK